MRSQQPQQSPQLAQLAAAHETAAAQAAQTQAAVEMLEHVKLGLDSLRKLGDMVQPEDVIHEAGVLVARGAPAGQMAALLADMPTSGGPGLQAWVAGHEAQVAQKEAQLLPAHAALGHRAALAGLQLIQGHLASGSQAASPAGANALMPSGPSASPVDPGASSLNVQGAS